MSGPGQPAVRHHKRLVDRLAAIARGHGCLVRRDVVIGRSLFKQPFAADLVIDGIPAFPAGLAILARYQAGRGSADQKLVYLAECVHQGVRRLPVAVVLDGDGWQVGALGYIEGRVGGPLAAAITVAEYERFIWQDGAGGYAGRPSAPQATARPREV